MRAMVLTRHGAPLEERDVPLRAPGPTEVRLRVLACAVCRTDLHVVDGELPDPKLPLVPGHQIVGIVEESGELVDHIRPGDRIGVPWLGWTCGECRYCRSDRENLCDHARFTGYHIDGGYAEYAVADARFAFRLPAEYDDAAVAPLLCAGLIGYRSYRFVADAQRIGFYGFGSAAHILTQIAIHDGRQVYAFTRAGDAESRAFARRLGVTWAGSSDEMPPESLDAAIIFAPVGGLVPAALRAVGKGGTVVCAGIHMSDIPRFPYSILWEERSIRSVANLTRRDGTDFFAVLERMKIRTEIEKFALRDANAALAALRSGRIQGSAVLVPER